VVGIIFVFVRTKTIFWKPIKSDIRIVLLMISELSFPKDLGVRMFGNVRFAGGLFFNMRVLEIWLPHSLLGDPIAKLGL
jgi:hypothetical protein